MSISGTIQGPFVQVYEDRTWFRDRWIPVLCFTRLTDDAPEIRFEIPTGDVRQHVANISAVLEANPTANLSFRMGQSTLTVTVSSGDWVIAAWAWNVCMVPHDASL